MKNIKRYEKHILLKEIREKGQRKLFSSNVAIVGCGGLGNIIANNLIRAGIGKIILVDNDYVELTNIHRQILFDERDARKKNLKVVVAAKKLRVINSEVEIVPVVNNINASNIEELIKNVDLVMDGTDNLETRFLINDTCVKHGIPWIYGAVIATEGMTMNILPDETACFRCLIRNIPSRGTLPTCDTAGILNTAVNVIASLQSTEAIKLLIGEKVRKEALHIDIWYGTWTQLRVEKAPLCITCRKKVFEFLEGKQTKYKRKSTN